MEVTRIIHPIGQGAFYTESIKTNDNLYNVVYDCGSGNHKYTPKRLKQDIASFYNPCLEQSRRGSLGIFQKLFEK